MSRHFGGTGTTHEIDTNARITSAGTITLMAWGYLLSAGSSNSGRFYSQDSDGAVGNEAYLVSALVGGGSQLRLNTDWDYDTTNMASASSESTLVTGQWMHIAVVHNSTTKRGELYVDGVGPLTLTLDTQGATTQVSPTSHHLFLGNRADNDRTFHGALAFPTAHGLGLTAGEIQQQMRWPGSVRRGLVGFWPLLSSEAGVEPDYSGQGVTGTVTGALSSTSAPPVCGMAVLPCPGGAY